MVYSFGGCKGNLKADGLLLLLLTLGYIFRNIETGNVRALFLY